MVSDFCKCGGNRREGQKNCHKCHAANMREFRRRTPLTPEQRMKDNARSYAGVYVRRGKIDRKPCEVNGCKSKPEMHHEDYTKPLEVNWLCRTHHLELHQRSNVEH